MENEKRAIEFLQCYNRLVHALTGWETAFLLDENLRRAMYALGPMGAKLMAETTEALDAYKAQARAMRRALEIVNAETPE